MVKAVLSSLAAFSRQLLDGFAALTGLYYSRKFAAIVRRLGLARLPALSAKERGTIVVQVDGLSRSHCQQAISQGVMPNLARFIRREGRVTQYRCGLPSTTPATQAAIMYGDKSGIPGFRWYDKLRQAAVVCRSPAFLAALQARFSLSNKGVLTGGSSYANMFDGGATRSLFTLSTLRPQRFFQNVQGIGLLGLFLLNPLRSLRVLYLVAREYVTDIYQRLTLRLGGKAYLPTWSVYTLLRIFSNVICREIETFAILVDIYRQVPIIYATYYSFDELAHHFGVDSSAARQALRSIDACIGHIDRFRTTSGVTHYELLVLGDHGLTPSTPFSKRFGGTLGDSIAACLDTSLMVREDQMGDEHAMLGERLLLDELKAIERNLGPAASRVARRIRFLVYRRIRRQLNDPARWNLGRQHDIFVQNSGCLSHVYFAVSDQPMDLSEISSLFPNLIVGLLQHEGIGTVVAREGSEVLALSRTGVLTIQESGHCRVEGQSPMAELESSVPAELYGMAHCEGSGDLMLLGKYDPRSEHVVSFESHWATHGGTGGPQDQPVLVYPRHFSWEPGSLTSPCALYALLARRRGWVNESEGIHGRQDEAPIGTHRRHPQPVS